uniref:(California timema) hypothetical protein n=1 Tax=Timema californicum TaxID=61474 RepID=A0A7R9IZU7_TIMCA|nr:unnamed protein product [Timema californicum]
MMSPCLALMPRDSHPGNGTGIESRSLDRKSHTCYNQSRSNLALFPKVSQQRQDRIALELGRQPPYYLSADCRGPEQIHRHAHIESKTISHKKSTLQNVYDGPTIVINSSNVDTFIRRYVKDTWDRIYIERNNRTLLDCLSEKYPFVRRRECELPVKTVRDCSDELGRAGHCSHEAMFVKVRRCSGKLGIERPRPVILLSICLSLPPFRVKSIIVITRRCAGHEERPLRALLLAWQLSSVFQVQFLQSSVHGTLAFEQEHRVRHSEQLHLTNSLQAAQIEGREDQTGTHSPAALVHSHPSGPGTLSITEQARPQTCSAWYAERRQCCLNASLVGGKLDRLRLFERATEAILSQMELTSSSFTPIDALRQLFRHLGGSCLYCDIDSIISVIRPTDTYTILTGDNLGDVTNELTAYSESAYDTEFVSGGPKNYSYNVFVPETNEYSSTTKARGITLNYENTKIVNFTTIKDLILKDMMDPSTRDQPAKN